MYNQEKKIFNNADSVKNIESRGKSSTACIFLLFLTIFYSINSFAQCAMCRAVLETEEGGVKAEAVNDGIVYLMAFPYILVGIIGYVVYKSRKPKAG